MAFSVTVSRAHDDSTLQVSGELDIASAAELRSAGEAAFAGDCSTLRLDLADVTFMDSTGLGVLIGLRNAAESSEKKLIITNPSPTVSRLLDLSGLLSIFTIEPAATV